MTGTKFHSSTLAGTVLAALCACSSAGNAVPRAGDLRPYGLTPGINGVDIKEFADLPQQTGYYTPAGIASGPRHSLWVTDVIDQDFGANAVVQIATSGKARNTFYYQGLSTQGSSLLGIVGGPDGALWITDEYNSQILRMTTDGTFTSYRVSAPPYSIAVGPDKALWFTEYSAIGRMTTDGKVRVYAGGSGNWGITAGPDGALWFAEVHANAIGRITTRGKITQFTAGISSGAGPYDITQGPDGALWFTESLKGSIGRITVKGKVTEYTRGIAAGEKPTGIAGGPDGALWFTEYESYNSYEIRESKIGRITTRGKISEYSRGLTSQAEPTTMVAGPDKRLWFVESAIGKTGRATP